MAAFGSVGAVAGSLIAVCVAGEDIGELLQDLSGNTTGPYDALTALSVITPELEEEAAEAAINLPPTTIASDTATTYRMGDAAASLAIAGGVTGGMAGIGMSAPGFTERWQAYAAEIERQKHESKGGGLQSE